MLKLERLLRNNVTRVFNVESFNCTGVVMCFNFFSDN